MNKVTIDSDDWSDVRVTYSQSSLYSLQVNNVSLQIATMYSADLLGWQKKPGPPRVWRLIEIRPKSANERPIKLSIQEIPEDRHKDVLDLMSTAFVRDEPICASTGVADDPEAIADFKKIWKFALAQGIVVGAFHVEDNNRKPILAGANMILVNNEAMERGMKQAIQLSSKKTEKLVKFMAGLDAEKDIRKFYNVDKYITAFGLFVKPEYRGMGIGYHLLKVRDDLSLEYDIDATSTVFSAPAAHKSAANAGFDVLIDRPFANVRNDDGTEAFPGIKSERCKLMGKRFSKQKSM